MEERVWNVGCDMSIREAAAMIERGEADCVLLRGQTVAHIGSGRGVRPLLQLLDSDPAQLSGAFLVDKIIGKAAAMLAVLGGVGGAYALTMSEPGKAYLDAHGIENRCGRLVPAVINRTGDGLCPLERAVMAVEDPHEGLAVLRETIRRLMAGR